MTLKSPNDNVRQRKAAPVQSTQHSLPITEISNDAVILKNGGLRAVLHIDSTNFNLKSETEQEAIIAGYGAFLNTLSFPIQILVRSTYINIDTYLTYLQSKIEQQKNPFILAQTTAHLNFIVRLLEVADIMHKHFYLILPADRNVLQKTLREKFFKWPRFKESAAKSVHGNLAFSDATRILNDRIELVQSGLHAIGLHSSRLRTRELIQLYYDIYNPKTSQNQRIPTDIGDLNTDATSF